MSFHPRGLTAHITTATPVAALLSLRGISASRSGPGSVESSLQRRMPTVWTTLLGGRPSRGPFEYSRRLLFIRDFGSDAGTEKVTLFITLFVIRASGHVLFLVVFPHWCCSCMVAAAALGKHQHIHSRHLSKKHWWIMIHKS